METSVVTLLLRDAEGPEGFFDFSLLRLHRQEPSGELIVSAQAERMSAFHVEA